MIRTIASAGADLRARRISSVELTRECLARIGQQNPKLNAFLTVLEKPALARASAMDAEMTHGIVRGPLHGIPIAHKDLFCTKGVATTSGSKVFAEYVPDFDATVVERLERAGAILLGKTSMHELAYGITSTNEHFGAVRNSHNPECIPGGSSGGSGVAVADGMALMATGSDTGGSIRIPASFCGVVGLKPTYGRVSRYGALPLGFSLDHVGPLTRTVADAAVTLGIIAGRDPKDDASSRRAVPGEFLPAGSEIRGLRIGRPEKFFFEQLQPEVAAAAEKALRDAEMLGARVVPVKLPDMDAVNLVALTVLLCEAAAALEPHLGQRDKFSKQVLSLLDQGRLLPATDYINAQRLRHKFAREFAAVWRQADVLLTPTTPTVAPKIGQTTIDIGGVATDVRLATTRLVRSFNLFGLPALSIPYGKSGGLPIGLQIIGPAFEEARVLRVGAALEATAS